MTNLQRLFKQIQEQQDAIRRMTAPFEAMQRHADETFAPLQQLAKSASAPAQMAEAIQRTMRPFLEAMRQQQDRWARGIRAIVHEVPQRMRKVQEYLFERGWYLSPEATLPGINAVARMIDDGQHEQIEEEMQVWVASRIDSILEEIGEEYLSRRQIIEDAIASHRDGRYTLSIPVLLAQADGLASEIIGTFLFRGQPVKDFERLMLSLEPTGQSSTLDALVAPLRFYSTLGKGQTPDAQRGMLGYMNRHEVLHGVSVDYAALPNGLRVIALIDYLLGIRHILDNRKELVREWQESLEEKLTPLSRAIDAQNRQPVTSEVCE